MNTITQYYFTLLFTFAAAIKSLQAWHLVNARLHNGGRQLQADLCSTVCSNSALIIWNSMLWRSNPHTCTNCYNHDLSHVETKYN